MKMSVHAILANKMRSLLTMLGIIIGIASVVSVVALGNASQAKILERISSMGTNTIDIMPGTGFGDMRSGKVKTLKVSDSDYLGRQSFVDSSKPSVSASGTLVYQNYSLTAQLSGVGSTYFDVKGRKIAQGRIFTQDEVDNIASVVVIDNNTLNEVFADMPNPIGKIIIFNKKPLEVIGVTEEDNNPGPMSDSMNIWVPYTTAMYKINGSTDINSILKTTPVHSQSNPEQDIYNPYFLSHKFPVRSVLPICSDNKYPLPASIPISFLLINIQ